MESRELVNGESRDPPLSALFSLTDRCAMTSSGAVADDLPARQTTRDRTASLRVCSTCKMITATHVGVALLLSSSVRLSVSWSVTRRYCTKMGKPRITQTTSYDSTGPI